MKLDSNHEGQSITHTEQAGNFCAVTVAIPTYRRPDKLLGTIKQVFKCNPAPAEIIVHVDGDDNETESLVVAKFPQVKVLKSITKVGPGGGRNKLIGAATNPIVASFDDDSFPIDTDYFGTLLGLFDQFPEAAIIGSKIWHIGEAIAEKDAALHWVMNFTGCGCAYRRNVFSSTSGYVPLPIAYGMEEIDLALRLHCEGWKILEAACLRVFHNTQLAHHAQRQIVAASIANLALLAYLRYPVTYWWYGVLQYLNRIYWLLRHKRWRGILLGLSITPVLIRQHWYNRQPIQSNCLASYRELRKMSVPIASKVV